MDILKKLPFQTVENFIIRVGAIEHGWMDITIATPEKQFSYLASYSTDPLNDLLNATVLLLTDKPFHIRGNWYLNEKAIVIHDLEGSIILWLIINSNGIFTILIWEDINQEMIEDLCHYNFESAIYQKFEFEEPPDLSKKLLFALNVSAIFFAKTLKNILDDLKERVEQNNYEDNWGYEYSEENYAKLINWLATHS